MRALDSLFPLLLAGPLAAQTLSYSRFDFGNAYRVDRQDFFPNARSQDGNVAGDFLYKALPKEVFARSDKIRISGVRISFVVDRSYQGNFPTFLGLPEIAFFPLVDGKIGGQTYDLPDLDRRASRSVPSVFIPLLRSSVQFFEIKLGPQNPDPRLRQPIELDPRDGAGGLQGWAVALLAPPGEKQSDGRPNFVAVPSFGEIHRTGSRPTYSGVYDARTKTFRPYGTPGAPSSIGELAVEIMLDQPTLQVFSDAAGGVRADRNKIETHKGPGAYVSDLATAVLPGFFGLFCQWEGQEDTGVWCLPLVTALGPVMPTQTIRVGSATLIWDPFRSSAVSIFLDTGNLGPLTVYRAQGHAGHAEDQPGVYATARLPVPPDKNLAGLTFWLQALLVRPSTQVLAATNLVRLAF